MRLQTGFLVSALVLVGACSAVDSTEDTAITTSALHDGDRCDGDRTDCTVHPDVIATGIPGAGPILQVAQFRRSSPLHDKATFLPFVAPGAVLNGARLLVGSSSNYGAPLYRTDQNPGTVLSIDPTSGSPVAVPAGFAAAGGQASSVGGLVQVYASNNAAFVNGLTEPQAVTPNEVSVSLPTGISINNGNGRPWVANSPTDAAGDGTITVLDPQGFPLAGAPDPVAGGVFKGDLTNRSAASTHGLTTGSLSTALMMKSSDGTGKAVFASINADGSIVQVHVLKGVDGMVPAGTITPVGTVSVATANSNDKHVISRIGMTFNWVPNRVIYVPDPGRNRLVAFDITDDGTLFIASAPRNVGHADMYDIPVDVAPTAPEIASENFASNTTAAGGSDLYVLNRGDNSVVRVTQDGKFVARRKIHVGDHHHFRANGIGVSPDGRNIWVSGQTATDGMVVRLDAFGSGDIMPALMSAAPSGDSVENMGSFFFSKSFSPDEGVGPLFNAQSCVACHGSPIAGGGSATVFDTFFTTAKDPATVARFHSVSELPGEHCGLDTGVPHHTTGTSVRSTMSLRSTSLIDFVLPTSITANQAAEPAAVRGRVATLSDGRIGRFGWKANVASLVEFMGGAYRNEMGLTNGLNRTDLESGCGANKDNPELDAVTLGSTAAFLTTVDAPAPTSCQTLPGAAVFTSSGCSGCHTPSFAGPGVTAWLYSDLLLHDMGAGLADGLAQGAATGSEFRTMTLVSIAERTHFLHDGRALNLSDAITAHGGQGAASAGAFSGLSATDQSSLLTFLNCL